MKMKGRVFKKEGGVSEVLGSILVLLITVLLFSTVFYYVSSMPTPNPKIYAQFDANLEIEQDASGQYYLNITVKNVGGEALMDWRTMFIVVIDFTAKQHMLSEAPLASQPFDSDGKFSQGESFYYNSSWDGFNYTDESAIRILDISVTLYDKNTGDIIWSSKLQGRTNMPPVLLRLTSSPAPVLLNSWVVIKAIVFDPDPNDDVSTYKVGVDFTVSDIRLSVNNTQNSGIDISYVPLTYSENNIFAKRLFFQDVESLNITRPFIVKVYIDDGKGNNITTNAYLFLSRGTEVKGPDLRITSEFISFSNLNPTRGEDVIVTVTIQNRGGTKANFKLEIRDEFGTNSLLVITNRGNPLPENDIYSVAAGGQTVITFIWREVGSKYINSTTGNEEFITGNVVGMHNISVKIVNINPAEDKNANHNDNLATSKITVLPRILFVDADQAMEGTSRDTSKYYEYILDTCNYHYDIKKVMGNIEVPVTYEFLEQYDLVIWETGYYGDSSSASAISLSQMENLSRYYGDGKSLWIISQEISTDYLNNTGNFSLNGSPGSFDGNITGVSNSYINLTLSNGNMVSAKLINRSGVENNDDVIYLSGGYSLIKNDTGNNLGVYNFNNKGGKFVYFGFELSRIDHYYTQNFIAYRVLNWLAGITGRVGSDVAVDDMSVNPSNPLYMEPVNITVVVSNNGESEISTQVMLKIDDEMSPDIITQNPVNIESIPSNGGYREVNFTWIPTVPGRHIITVYIDPYNLIKETNEENNMLNTKVIDNKIYVHFSTVIMYNSTSVPSDVENITAGLRYLGYKYNITNVNNPAEIPEGYENGTYFRRYNLVVWVVKDQNDLGEGDIDAIKNAVENLVVSQAGSRLNFLFVGQPVPDILENEADLADTFGVSKSTGSSFSAKSVLFGVNNPESVTNGLAYIINPQSTIHKLKSVGNITVEALFRNPLFIGNSTLESTYLKRSDTIPDSGYGVLSYPSFGKAAFIPFSLKDIVGIYGMKFSLTSASVTPYKPALQAKAEFLYHLFHWFGERDETPELAVYSPEIEIKYGGNMELPIIVGRSYMLRATVYNYGTTGVSAVVRFYDDLEWIGGQTVYVPGMGSAQVEIQWTPMFAGSGRHISVVVDPLDEIMETAVKNNATYKGKEIFNYNNEAIITKRVYYFWDNMENGDKNWLHQATVMDINGESPLDFLNRQDVSTNVIGKWDWSKSGISDNSGNYINKGNVFYTNDTRVSTFTGGAYHSATTAFWMPEAPRAEGVRKPIDLILLIDVSGSMNWDDGYGNSRLDDAKEAARGAVSLLREGDRVAIITFSYDVDIVLDFHPCNTSQDRDYINDTIDSLRAGGATSLFDGASYATYYMDNNGREDAVKGIIFLTDGVSNDDDETSSTYYKYAPGDGSGEEPDEPGPIQWYTDGKGLCGIPYNVFTVSIGQTPDARMHAIASTSTGKIAYGVWTADATKLKELFMMFVQSLVEVSTGGIRAADTRALNLKAGTISDVPFVIFADGFRSKDWNARGYGNWQHSGWEYNDGGLSYDGDRTSLLSMVNGDEISIEIHPTETLSKLPGTYVLKDYRLSFLAYGQRRSELEIQISLDGVNWNTIDSFRPRGSYYIYSLSSYISSEQAFYLRFLNSGEDGRRLYLDDVMVTAVVDYTPSTSSGTSVESAYLQTIETTYNYTYLITPPVNIEDAKKAILTFWTKYWMTQGTNGGIIYLWGSEDGVTWTWDKNHRYYLMPTQSYTGNLKPKPFESGDVIGQKGPVINEEQNGLEDATYTGSGTQGLPLWCFNGRSGDGTFGWDYVEVDLTPYISQFKEIRIVFMLVQFGGITPEFGWNPSMGWYLDDVKITITGDGQKDLWKLNDFGGTGNKKAHSGKYAWVYEDTSENLPQGIDSSLITKQIDMSTARSAILDFYIRFNLNPAAGVPPATVRVEVSDDNGMTWRSITYGVRIGWNASGTGGIAGTLEDGSTGYGWVNSGTLVRINCDLSGWAGHSIMIRFRVVTNATSTTTYDPYHSSDPHGVFLDDVVVYGESYTTPINPKAIWE